VVEGLILDWEKALNTLLLEYLNHLLVFEEVSKLTALGVLRLDLHCLRVHVPE
jgi:hypothetical protein